VVKEQMRRSYRGAEALLRDCDGRLRDVGLRRAPDHNTLCRAAAFLLAKLRVGKLLDKLVQWAAVAGILGLSSDPLAIDSTTYESRHVSRHYERRCRQTRKRMHERMRAKEAEKGGKTTRSDTVKALPKLGIGVATACHLVLSAWTGTGAGADHPHFEPVLFDAWRRVPHRSFTAVLDAGYDGEQYHDPRPPRHGHPQHHPARDRAAAQGRRPALRPLAAAHEAAAEDQTLAPPLRVHPPLPGRDRQQHDEAEPRQRARRQDRRLPRTRHAAQSAHARPDGRLSEGRDRA
jgi:hypothetical protein